MTGYWMRIFVVSLMLLVSAPLGLAQAGVISSPDGTFLVGITPLGNLYDPGAGIGFMRVADGYDPIAPGTPREAWGAALGGVSGYADGMFTGDSNLILNSAVFGANSATVNTTLDAGAGALLIINQDYTFAASNVLKILATITNVSGSDAALLFSRNVDWDIAPTTFAESIVVTPYGAPVSSASCFGFESPDPTAPFIAPVGPAGGACGPGDLGGGYLIDLGILTAGGSIAFNLFEAISQIGQSRLGLEGQLFALGASTVITGVDSAGDFNSAALAFGPAGVPEPASLLLLGAGLAALGGIRSRWSRRA